MKNDDIGWRQVMEETLANYNDRLNAVGAGSVAVGGDMNNVVVVTGGERGGSKARALAVENLLLDIASTPRTMALLDHYAPGIYNRVVALTGDKRDGTKVVYLASPYSHIHGEVRQARYEAAVEALAIAAREKIVMLSPIVHSHPVAEANKDIPGNWEFWEEADTQLLARCDELWILCIEGWMNSRGVRAEFDFAVRRGIPVRFKEIAKIGEKKIFSRVDNLLDELPEGWI